MTVSPGWYDDGVTPGVERWFDGRGWTETTRPAVPALPVGDAWLPQEAPALPEPAPALPEPAPAAHGLTIPTLEPEPEPEPAPARASSAAAAGYPTFGTPYRGPDGGAAAAAGAGTAGAATASPYTAASAAPLASPYTNAVASPYPGTGSAPSTSSPPPPPPPPPVAAPYTTAATGFPATGFPATGQASRFGSEGDVAGDGAAGLRYGAGTPYGAGQPFGAGFGGARPGTGPALGGPQQDLLERAFRSEATEKASSDRQTALIVGGLGVGLLVIAGGVLRATLSMGTGTVWTWGFLAGGALLVKAGMSYFSAVRRGARHLGALGWTVSGGALLLAGVVVVTSIQAAFSPMPVEVGSCFTDEGPEVQQVECADPHDYTAVAVVDSLGECPSVSDVFARFDGEVVCLVDAGLGFGD